MPAKYIGLLVFIWVVAALIGGVMEQQYLGENEAGVLDCLLGMEAITEEGDYGETETPGPITGLKSGLGWLSALWNLLWFNFAFLTGPWVLVKWIFLFPIMATVIFGLIIIFFSTFRRGI